jgi:hypothetical protein
MAGWESDNNNNGGLQMYRVAAVMSIKRIILYSLRLSSFESSKFSLQLLLLPPTSTLHAIQAITSQLLPLQP